MPQKSTNAYDFDHTIYRGDASLDFIIYCTLHHPTVIRYLPLQVWTLLLYVLGKRTRKQVKQVAFLFLKNLSDVNEDLHRFWAKNESKLEDWYVNQKKPNDVIVSASPEFLLQPIVTKLGVKQLIGTRMDKVTGKITGENCRGEEKVVRLKHRKLNIAFHSVYSDTLSDLPLLNLAKHPYIVHKGNIMTLKQYKVDGGSTGKRNTAGSKNTLLRELFLYGVIGGSTATLDILLFYAFVALGVPLLIANFISVSISLGLSFALNAKYNFKKTDNYTKRAGTFFLIGYFGLFVQSIVLLLGVSAMGFRETYVKILAVFIAAAIQYISNKFLTFKD